MAPSRAADGESAAHHAHPRTRTRRALGRSWLPEAGRRFPGRTPPRPHVGSCRPPGLHVPNRAASALLVSVYFEGLCSADLGCLPVTHQLVQLQNCRERVCPWKTPVALAVRPAPPSQPRVTLVLLCLHVPWDPSHFSQWLWETQGARVPSVLGKREPGESSSKQASWGRALIHRLTAWRLEVQVCGGGGAAAQGCSGDPPGLSPAPAALLAAFASPWLPEASL